MIKFKFVLIFVVVVPLTLFAEIDKFSILSNNRTKIVDALSSCLEKNKLVIPCNFEGKDDLVRLLNISFDSLQNKEKDTVVELFSRHLFPNVTYSLYRIFVIPPNDSIMYPFLREMLTDGNVRIAEWACSILLSNTNLSRIRDYELTAKDITHSPLSLEKKRDLALLFNVRELLVDTSGMKQYQKAWYGDKSAEKTFKDELVACQNENDKKKYLRSYTNMWQVIDFKMVLKEFNSPVYKVAGRCTLSTFQNEILDGLRRYHPEDSLFDSRMEYFMSGIGEYFEYQNRRRYLDNVALFVRKVYGLNLDTNSLRRFATREHPKHWRTGKRRTTTSK